MFNFYKLITVFVSFCFFVGSLQATLPLLVQKPYQKERHLAFRISQLKETKILAKEIMEGANYKKIYDLARIWRHELALSQKIRCGYLFGADRAEMGSVLYSSLNVIGGIQCLPSLDLYLAKGEYRRSIPELGLKGALVKCYQIKSKLGTETIPLTQIIKLEDPLEDVHLNYSIYFGDVIERRYLWIHTSWPCLQKIHQELETLFQQIIKEQEPKRSVYLIGLFHWWFCQATPCMRGSAAIGEVLSGALMTYKGFDCVLKEGVYPDLTALSQEDCQAFANNYENFYDFSK